MIAGGKMIVRVSKTSPNESFRLVWAIGMCSFYFFVIFIHISVTPPPTRVIKPVVPAVPPTRTPQYPYPYSTGTDLHGYGYGSGIFTRGLPGIVTSCSVQQAPSISFMRIFNASEACRIASWYIDFAVVKASGPSHALLTSLIVKASGPSHSLLTSLIVKASRPLHAPFDFANNQGQQANVLIFIYIYWLRYSQRATVYFHMHILTSL